MLKKLHKSNKRGFTIIEVMIVLAIAGLILLIVFLAVPALQRSSRNTQRKTDVGRIGAAATTIVSNNNGKVDTTVLTSGASGTVATETGTNLSFYQPANISVKDGTTNPVTNNTTKDTVYVVANGKCGTNTSDPTVPSSRSIAVLYSTESGSSVSHICVDQ